MIGWLFACSAACLLIAHGTPERRYAIRWLAGGIAWASIATLAARL